MDASNLNYTMLKLNYTVLKRNTYRIAPTHNFHTKTTDNIVRRQGFKTTVATVQLDISVHSSLELRWR